jgi:hypothetical protein
MRTFVAMAHYDPHGLVAPHVRRHVLALKAVAERVTVVSTADLQTSDERWLRQHVDLVRRDNYGYDFLSYRAGLEAETSLSDYDRVVVCNDSFVGPLVGYDQIFEAMDQRPVDFWGLTKSERVAPHVQSFFMCFRPWVVRSQAFRDFWGRMTPLSDRREVILRYEVGFTTLLTQAGFAFGSYFDEDPEDIAMARRRMRWWAALRSKGLLTPAQRQVWHRRAGEAWNPCIGLADRCLGGARLPLTKIDTLRFDPYGLDAQRLLAACVAAMPDEFAGVPQYLERTQDLYPVRPAEVLDEPAPEVRWARRLVRYA